MVRLSSNYKINKSTSIPVKNIENEEFTNLMSEVSINFKEIRRSPNIFWKLVWITAFLSLTMLCGYQVYKVSQRYFRYQTTTQFKKIQPNTVPLPNLHLCSEHWLSKEAQIYFDEQRYGNYVMDYFQDFSKPHYSITQLKERSDLYSKQENGSSLFTIKQCAALSPAEFWEMYQKSAASNLAKCQISFLDLRNCAESITESIYYSGLFGPVTCYVVSPQKIANQSREGWYGGFSLYLQNWYDLDATECDPELPSEQCVWYVHISFPNSHTRKETFKLKAGFWLQIQLTEIRNTFLGHPYGAPCHTNSNDPYYSRNECISDRIVAYYQTLVNCTPFGYKEISLNETATENINWCPPELAVQLEEKLKEEDVIQQLNKFVNGEYEECVKPCKDITLNIYTEYSRLSESESSGNMSRGMSKISIYHKSLEVEEWIERPYTTFSDLVIEVGAILTFWLGIRFMNMLQIAYFVFLALKRQVFNQITTPTDNQRGTNTFSLAHL